MIKNIYFLHFFQTVGKTHHHECLSTLTFKHFNLILVYTVKQAHKEKCFIKSTRKYSSLKLGSNNMYMTLSSTGGLSELKNRFVREQSLSRGCSSKSHTEANRSSAREWKLCRFPQVVESCLTRKYLIATRGKKDPGGFPELLV